MCCVRKYENNGSHLPCPRNFLIARKYLRRQAMMSLRSISARFRFLLAKVKPMSFISLHKVVFVKFGKSSSSLTALITLSSVGISLLAYMLCTFRRMAWIVKLSCLTVRELEIFTSRARFFGDTKGPRRRSAFNFATVRGDIPVSSLTTLSTSRTDFSGKRILVRAYTFAITCLACFDSFDVRSFEKIRAGEVVEDAELDAIFSKLPQQVKKKKTAARVARRAKT